MCDRVGGIMGVVMSGCVDGCVWRVGRYIISTSTYLNNRLKPQ